MPKFFFTVLSDVTQSAPLFAFELIDIASSLTRTDFAGSTFLATRKSDDLLFPLCNLDGCNLQFPSRPEADCRESVGTAWLLSQ